MSAHACLGVCGERCVASHEVVETGGGDEGGNQADEIVVHVARVAEGCCASSHYRGHLGEGGGGGGEGGREGGTVTACYFTTVCGYELPERPFHPL